jgi:chromosome segregation ATPase
MGGFVVSSNVYQTSYGDSRLEEAVIAKQASITIRVPSDQLDQALEQIKDAAVEVRSQNMSGQDVTEEYTDLQSRLGNLEAAESELREIMESASERDEIEDVLAVLNELRRVREEIEVLRGRIQYLEQSARLSSISVELLPDVASQPLQIGRWTPEGTAREAVEALVGALQNLAEAGIYVVICGLPAAILLGVPAWLGLRAIRRRGTAAPAKPEKAN